MKNVLYTTLLVATLASAASANEGGCIVIFNDGDISQCTIEFTSDGTAVVRAEKPPVRPLFLTTTATNEPSTQQKLIVVPAGSAVATREQR